MCQSLQKIGLDREHHHHALNQDLNRDLDPDQDPDRDRLWLD